MNNPIVLLGDSIFDNASYVGHKGRPIIDYLNDFVDKNTRAILLARDGATMRDVPRQIKKIPKEAAHIFLSIGGNNILNHLPFLEETGASVLEVLNKFYEMRKSFEKEYFTLLEKLKNIGIPITVCAIYNCSFEGEKKQKGVEMAIALFDDAIIRSAYRLSIPYIDLRDVCTEPSDYVNRIEPSDAGGRKIAKRLANKN